MTRAIAGRQYVWYLDPIDGTDNYVEEDGQYVVMLGLVVAGQLVYGCIYAPARDEHYFGGPPSAVAEQLGYVGVWQRTAGPSPERVSLHPQTAERMVFDHLRAIVGSWDRRDHPEMVERLKAEQWVSVGSVGLKVMAIVNGEADVYLPCSQQLKFWDTAAPVTLAWAAGLTVCDLHGEPLQFTMPMDGVGEGLFRHRQMVLIGTPAEVTAVRRRLGFL